MSGRHDRSPRSKGPASRLRKAISPSVLPVSSLSPQQQETLLAYIDLLEQAINWLADALGSGHRVLVAADSSDEQDAEQFARLLNIRFAVAGHCPAIALSCDPAIFGQVGCGWREDERLAKQVKVLAERRDVLVAVCQREPSDGLLNALQAARERQLARIAFAGPSGQSLVKHAEVCLIAPASIPDIRELHRDAWSLIADVIESNLRESGQC